MTETDAKSRVLESYEQVTIAASTCLAQYRKGHARHGDSWRDVDVLFLLEKMDEEVGELRKALRSGTPSEVKEEAKDVGAVALMLVARLHEVLGSPLLSPSSTELAGVPER